MVSKTELVAKIAEETGESQAVVKTIVEAFWKEIRPSVEAGEEVRFIGYGKFFKKHSDARKGINPSTKEPIDIPASDRLAFKSALKF